MTGAEIFALIKMFGPLGLSVAKDLAKIWTKDLTPEEVDTLTSRYMTEYETYISNAGGRPTK